MLLLIVIAISYHWRKATSMGKVLSISAVFLFTRLSRKVYRCRSFSKSSFRCRSNHLCGLQLAPFAKKRERSCIFFDIFLKPGNRNIGATILELIYSLFILENQAMHSGNEISTEFFSREARKSMFRAALDSCNLRFNGNHFLIQPVILLTPILPKVCTHNNSFDPSHLVSIGLSIRYFPD